MAECKENANRNNTEKLSIHRIDNYWQAVWFKNINSRSRDDFIFIFFFDSTLVSYFLKHL